MAYWFLFLAGMCLGFLSGILCEKFSEKSKSTRLTVHGRACPCGKYTAAFESADEVSRSAV